MSTSSALQRLLRSRKRAFPFAFVVLMASALVAAAFIVLAIPHLGQQDEEWKTHPLGQRTEECTEHAITNCIGGQGCAVTSAAMVLQALGVQLDPDDVNDRLAATPTASEKKSGETAAMSDMNIVWGDWGHSIHRWREVSQGLVECIWRWYPTDADKDGSKADDLADFVDERLEQGDYLIAKTPSTAGVHFVVITRRDDEGTYWIQDPMLSEDKEVEFKENINGVAPESIIEIVVFGSSETPPTNNISVSNDQIREKYYQVCGARGVLGNPTGEAQRIENAPGKSNAWYQRFEGGVIYTYEENGVSRANWIDANIAAKHDASGGPSGNAGFPVSDPYGVVVDGEVKLWRSDFEGASIFWSLANEEAMYASGYKAEYFPNSDLSGDPVLVRWDPYILFDWGDQPPSPIGPRGAFSVRWVGSFIAPTYGLYRFNTLSHGGVRIAVDGDEVFDALYGQPKFAHSGVKMLGPGVHIVEIDYAKFADEDAYVVYFMDQIWPADTAVAANVSEEEQVALGSFDVLPQVFPSASQESSQKIAVTPSQFDDIGAILTDLGIQWSAIQDSDLTSYESIRDYDVIFANCSVEAFEAAPGVSTALRRFVQKGGSFYASDWAFSYVNAAFPGFVTPGEGIQIGEEQSIRARVVDAGLSSYLDPLNPVDELDIDFDLDAWVPIASVAEEVTVHLRGSFSVSSNVANAATTSERTFSPSPSSAASSWWQDRPISISFSPFGSSGGKVIYTSYHNHAQSTDVQRRLLSYLSLVPSTHREQREAQQALDSSGVVLLRTDLGLLPKQGSSIEGFYENLNTARLAVSTAWAGSSLQTDLYEPGGSLYQSVIADSSPTSIVVDSPELGTWRYRVTAVSIPYDNYPYVVGIGKVPQRRLELRTGWNLISTQVLPPDSSLAAVLEPVQQSVEAVLGYSGGPLSFYPGIPEQDNTLLNVDPKHGYWIKTISPISLPLTGTIPPPQYPIALQEGWNLIGFLPSEPLSVRDAFWSIDGNYTAVLGFDGEPRSFYTTIPEQFNTLRELLPGHGYWVWSTKQQILTYSNGAYTTSMPEQADTTDFNPAEAPQFSMPLWTDFYVTVMVGGQSAESGLEVTAFDSQGVLVGRGVVKHEGRVGIVSVSGDDPATSQDEGAMPQEPIIFRVAGVVAQSEPAAAMHGLGELTHIQLNAVPDNGSTPLYLPMVGH